MKQIFIQNYTLLLKEIPLKLYSSDLNDALLNLFNYMNFENQPTLKKSEAYFSSTTIHSLLKSKSKFQRKKSNEKSGISSSSKKTSCESLPLQKYFVKKPSFKVLDPKKEYHTICNSSVLANHVNNPKANKNNAQVQYRLNDQMTQPSQRQANGQQIYFERLMMNSQYSEQNKRQLKFLLKKIVLYKQKYQKYQQSIKELKTQKLTFQAMIEMFRQDNQQLKNQVKVLKLLIDSYIDQNIYKQSLEKKNTQKLQKQYQQFLQQEENLKNSFQFKFYKLSHEFQSIKLQNQKIMMDFVKQNDTYNMKLKMMQQKQEFLQKTLNFTQDTLKQMQNNYQFKQGQLFQFKRLSQIINKKTQQIQTWKNRYNSILKMVNGDKKKGQKQKKQDKKQIPSIFTVSKNRSSSKQVKKFIISHKQNRQMEPNVSKTNASQSKLYQSIRFKLQNDSLQKKQNCQPNQLKTKREIADKWNPTIDKEMRQDQNYQDMSLYLSSLELTPSESSFKDIPQNQKNFDQ